MWAKKDKSVQKTTLKRLTQNTSREGNKTMLGKFQKGLGEVRKGLEEIKENLAGLKNDIAEINNRRRRDVESDQQESTQNPPFDIEDTDPENSRETIANTDHQTTDEQRITAELCLIVPARLVSNLTPRQTLTREQICELIDNCAYFCCLPSRDLDSLEQDLQRTSEPILHDSERDVYIRIQIEDGENMIDNPSCYGLKKRLPQTGTCELQERLLLANLSGRQHFNRI